MRQKLIIYTTTAIIAICIATAAVYGMAKMGFLDKDKFTEHVECTVVGSGEQAAIGDVFIFNIDGLKSVKVQKSQCFNMEDVKQGDTFKAVEVNDENDVLQWIVKVTY